MWRKRHRFQAGQAPLSAPKVKTPLVLRLSRMLGSRSIFSPLLRCGERRWKWHPVGGVLICDQAVASLVPAHHPKSAVPHGASRCPRKCHLCVTAGILGFTIPPTAEQDGSSIPRRSFYRSPFHPSISCIARFEARSCHCCRSFARERMAAAMRSACIYFAITICSLSPGAGKPVATCAARSSTTATIARKSS